MAALAVWALYEHAVAPALRFLVTPPANQVIDELGERLRIGIRPFQRTKRQALIHSLLADRRVQAAAEKYARDKDITDRKSTRLNSSHGYISYAVFCLKKKK